MPVPVTCATGLLKPGPSFDLILMESQCCAGTSFSRPSIYLVCSVMQARWSQEYVYQKSRFHMVILVHNCLYEIALVESAKNALRLEAVIMPSIPIHKR